MSNEKRAGTYQQVYHQLKQEILHLELPPGSSISETETAIRFQTSRTPVRDAFKILEIEGLILLKLKMAYLLSKSSNQLSVLLLYFTGEPLKA